MQLYFNLCSFFPTNDLIKPTESLLRKALIGFGSILDISVKDYHNHPDQSLQEGYGFLWLSNSEDAARMVSIVQNMNYYGISISCSPLRQRNNQTELFQSSSPYGNIHNNYIPNIVSSHVSFPSQPISLPYPPMERCSSSYLNPFFLDNVSQQSLSIHNRQDNK